MRILRFSSFVKSERAAAFRRYAQAFLKCCPGNVQQAAYDNYMRLDEVLALLADSREITKRRSDVRSWRLEVGGWSLKVGDYRLEVGGQRLEI